MNSNAAAAKQMDVDRGRNANDMPNLVKALSCVGSGAGLYLGSKVKAENSSRHDLTMLTICAGAGGAAGFLFGYAIHYSLLAIVDGVRMIASCLESPSSDASSNRAQSASVPSNPASES